MPRCPGEALLRDGLELTSRSRREVVGVHLAASAERVDARCDDRLWRSRPPCDRIAMAERGQLAGRDANEREIGRFFRAAPDREQRAVDGPAARLPRSADRRGIHVWDELAVRSIGHAADSHAAVVREGVALATARDRPEET